LLGESLREIGVLVLVFVPLDMVLRENNPDANVNPRWMFWLQWLSMAHWIELFFGVAGIFLLYFGIKIETAATLEEREGDRQNDVPDSGI
jgi:hypothetical protein